MSALPPGTPPAELELDVSLVRELLAHQHPDLADRRIEPVDAGWDNAMFRLGDDLCVRLPRREAAAPLLEAEQAWLPRLAPALPLPVPVPLRIGVPGPRYPWRWSVCRWLPGDAADRAPLGPGQATVLADFLVALHQPAPPDAPQNPYRGVPLRQRHEGVQARIESLRAQRAHFSPQTEARAQALWRRALAAPVDPTPTWVHGDLHARNVLTCDGALSAVIDWGDLCRGDRATDLAALWMLLPTSEARTEAIDRVSAATGISEEVWHRARGWAVLFGCALLDSGLVDHPRHADMGARVLARVTEP